MNIVFVSPDSVRGPFFEDDAVVVGLWSDGSVESCLDSSLLEGWFKKAVQRVEKTGKCLSTRGKAILIAAPPRIGAGRVVVIGLGNRRVSLRPLEVERLGADLGAILWKTGAEQLVLTVPLSPSLAAYLAMGLSLRCAPLPSWGKKEKREIPSLKTGKIVSHHYKDAGDAFFPLHAIADSVLWARRLTDAPSNFLTPKNLVREAESLRELGVDIEVLDKSGLQEEGLNLLLAVGKGSHEPSRLVCLRWKGEGASLRPVALVGKGITFDTGGISLKPADGMEAMKGDMGGAATVLATMQSLALQKAPVHVVGVLALAENMVSGKATRPGDIVKAANGMTVEIVDADAEGRLVLADALSWVCKRYRPTAAVTLATLTGSVIVTLGRSYAGLMTAHDAMAARLESAARQTGEAVWRLPLDPAYAKAIASPVADLRNCAWERGPDALHAALFLSHFVEGGTRWAHLDIAGVSETKDDLPLCPKGATGYGVRLLNRWIELEQAGRS